MNVTCFITATIAMGLVGWMLRGIYDTIMEWREELKQCKREHNEEDA